MPASISIWLQWHVDGLPDGEAAFAGKFTACPFALMTLTG
jgi:hypothetical protein